jgi:CubicO group peptidase (beta-lactamase class C family)
MLEVDYLTSKGIGWLYDEMRRLPYTGEYPWHNGGMPGSSSLVVVDPENRSAFLVFRNQLLTSGEDAITNSQHFFFDLGERLSVETGL